MPILTFDNVTKNQLETLARSLADNAVVGVPFLLEGELGVGKTTFSRSFIQHLCGNDTEVPSPTFTIVQSYHSKRGEIWHYDLYRISSSNEMYELGIEESIGTGICLIEWPDFVKEQWPEHTLIIIAYAGDCKKRNVQIIIPDNGQDTANKLKKTFRQYISGNIV